jgi:hypothetical protein
MTRDSDRAGMLISRTARSDTDSHTVAFSVFRGTTVIRDLDLSNSLKARVKITHRRFTSQENSDALFLG